LFVKIGNMLQEIVTFCRIYIIDNVNEVIYLEIIRNLSERVYCQTCKRKTNHGIGYQHEERDSPIDDIRWQEKYYIVKCLGCDTICFVKEYGDETMVEPDEWGEWNHVTHITVYPEEPITQTKRNQKEHEVFNFDQAPEFINILYKQVVFSFNNNSYLLSTVGLRMLIEGICNDLGIKDGYILNEQGEKILDDKGNQKKGANLKGRINGLVEKELIVQTQANILHQIRELGNASAHSLESPSRKIVASALSIIENIIYNIYDLKKFQLK
jgi:hypothetical protein